MSEFDGIKNLEGWRQKLESMLAKAREIAQDDDLDARLNMSDRLTDFILESRPQTDEITELDLIAQQAAEALLLSELSERLTSITSRTAELRRLAKKFANLAKENEAAAASIRLENITETINATTAMVNTIKKLKESLGSSAKDKKDADLIDPTVKAIEDMRAKVGRLL